MFGVCVFITFVNTWLALDRSYEAVLAKRIEHPSPFEVLDGTYRIWGILYSILGAGCLLWEHRQGGLSFSLGLPVRLAHFNLIRAAVGFAQVVFLGSLPSFAAGWLHELLRPELAFVIIPAFTAMGIALGLASFGAAYFVGAFLRNLYLSTGVGWIIGVGSAFLLAELPLTANLAGMNLLRQLGTLPAKPVAWLPVCGYAGTALIFVIAGAYISERRSRLEIQ